MQELNMEKEAACIHGFFDTSITAKGNETTSQLQEKDKICNPEGSIS